MWRPTVGPDGTLRRVVGRHRSAPRPTTAWPGSRTAASWCSGRGRPTTSTTQVLAGDRPDRLGRPLGRGRDAARACGRRRGGPDEPATLSLYTVDPATGRADLDHPKLDKAPAFDGFSLRDGRLAWSAPGRRRRHDRPGPRLEGRPRSGGSSSSTEDGTHRRPLAREPRPRCDRLPRRCDADRSSRSRRSSPRSPWPGCRPPPARRPRRRCGSRPPAPSPA